MDWSDDAVVLSAKRHGETSAVVSLLTRAHGRHAGLVRGAASPPTRGIYQPGNELKARWRGRLPEHLGHFTCEPVRLRAPALLEDADRLAALSSACALLQVTLPERQPCPGLFASVTKLLHDIERTDSWPARYVAWELELLAELGFGLDLSACAATGVTEGLAYVSPRTGRAVSAAAGRPYRNRLLRLPPFLTARAQGAECRYGEVRPGEIAEGLKLTGHFLERHVFSPPDRPMPAARHRLVARLARSDPRSCGI